MSTTGMVNLQNCPRDVENLLQIKRGVRYRLGLQISMFSDQTAEQAFLSASNEDQAQALSSALQAFDAAGGGSNGQSAAVAPQAAPQPAQPQMPQQGQPQQLPLNMQVVGQQPVMPPASPAMPPQPAQPQMPQQPAMPPQPAAPAVAGPTMPQMPAAPAAPVAPAQPQMPQQPQMPPTPQPIAQPVAPPPQQPQIAQPVPPPQPVTAADPNNAGAELGTSIPQKLDGILKALKKVAEVGESNQEWIEEIHDHSLGNSRVLHTLLLMQLVIIEQMQGFDMGVLVKLMQSKDANTVESFLKNFVTESESGEG